jgi:hypothetical protein
VSVEAGGVAERDTQVGFAEADIADQDDVGVGGDEGEAEQVLDLRTIYLLGPVPLEIIKGLNDGEARIPDAALDTAVLAQRCFAVCELGEIIDMRALLLGGLAGCGLIVAFEVAQLQSLQLGVQSRLVTLGHDRSPRRR